MKYFLRLVKKFLLVVLTGQLWFKIKQEYDSFQNNPTSFSLKWQYVLKSPFVKVKLDFPVVAVSLMNVTQKDAVDVVIPWYGDENIFPLLTKLTQDSSSFINTIYVIDDCFPNLDLSVKLEKTINKMDASQVKYVRTKQNQGFVVTANHGLRLSQNDVVLLNSDVVPQGNWLQHMVEVSKSNEAIATVTPLSNNATIFSIPQMNMVNNDDAPEETALLVEKIAPVPYLEVPTAHGFCMLMKRKYLKKYGYLDEKTYGRGYGEENALSQLYREEGLLNVMSLRSYVLHLESQSFGDDVRKQQIAENLPKVVKRFPTYPQQVAEFMATDPLSSLRQLLTFFQTDERLTWLDQPAVMILLHMNPLTVIGGVEKESMAQLKYVSEKYPDHLLVLYFYDNETGLYSVCIIKNDALLCTFSFKNNHYPDGFLRWILTTFNIKLTIVEHLMNHSLNYPSLLKKYHVPSLLFIHDFYFMCQIPDLINEQGEFCGYENGVLACERCLPQVLGSFIPQKVWEQHCLEILKSDFDYIVFNSEFTLKEYLKYYSITKKPRYVVSYPELGVRLDD